VLPAIKLDPSLQPVVDRLDPKTAAAFRSFVQQSFAQAAPAVDKMTGIQASMLLMGEGQTPPNPSVGGTIVDGAPKLGRPSMGLISAPELQSMALAENQTANLAARDKRIGQDTIAYLLDLREGWPDRPAIRAALRRAPRRRPPQSRCRTDKTRRLRPRANFEHGRDQLPARKPSRGHAQNGPRRRRLRPDTARRAGLRRRHHCRAPKKRQFGHGGSLTFRQARSHLAKCRLIVSVSTPAYGDGGTGVR